MLSSRAKPSLDAYEVIGCLAKRATTPISISNLFKFAHRPSDEQMLRNAQFLHRELPIRLSQCVDDLASLPMGLSSLEGVQSIRNLYARGVHDYLATKQPTCPKSEVQTQYMFGGSRVTA